MIGKARKNGGNGEADKKSYVSVPNYDSFRLGDTFTASGFFRVTGRGGWYRLISRKGPKTEGWGQELNWNDDTQLSVYGSYSKTPVVTVPDLEHNWVHLTLAYEGTSCTVYANGNKIDTVSIYAAQDNGQPLSFGCTSDGNDWALCGDYDEIRLTAAQPTAAQVKFEYAAMTQADFLTPGSVQAVDAAVSAVTVEKLTDAQEEGLVPGGFRLARERVSMVPQKVSYAFSGTAVPGVDYEGTPTGEIVIPPGADHVDMPIAVKYNPSVSEDRTIVLTVDGGASAELTIVNLLAPTKGAFKKMIEFTAPAAFLGEETLEGFPILVRLSTAIEGFDYADFKQPDGGDLLFTDAKGQTVYAHEVDEWNPDGESLVWVFVPRFVAGTTFRLYYGSTMDLGGAIKGPKWPGFVGVWHFNEGTWRKPVADATGHGLDAQVMAQYYPSYNDDYAPGGVVGRARWNMPCSYQDGGRNYYSVPNYDSQNVGDEFVMSCWVKAEGMAGYPRIVSRKTAYDSKEGWEVEVGHSYTALSVRGAEYSGPSMTIPDMHADWVHLVFRFTINNGKTITMYANANGEPVELADPKTSPTLDNGLPLSFGCNSRGNEASFWGAFDEFRLKRGLVTDNWAKAEYLTVKDANFLRASAVKPAVSGLVLLFR